MKKYIKIMPDFECSGIWDELNGGIMLEYEDLDLPLNLINKFKKWINYYESSWNRDYSRMEKKKAKVVNKRGLELAKELKKLFPKSKIVYIGESYDCKLLETIVI